MDPYVANPAYTLTLTPTPTPTLTPLPTLTPAPSFTPTITPSPLPATPATTLTPIPCSDLQVQTSLLGFTIPTFSDLLTFAIRGFFTIAGIAALFLLLQGAFEWVTSGGDKAKVEAAQRRMTTAVVGVIMIIVVLAIVWTLENVVFNRAICFGLTCPVTIPSLISPTTPPPPQPCVGSGTTTTGSGGSSGGVSSDTTSAGGSGSVSLPVGGPNTGAGAGSNALSPTSAYYNKEDLQIKNFFNVEK